MKTCNICNLEKPKTAFSNHKKTKDRLHPTCKQCRASISRERHAENPEKTAARCRAYYEANREKVAASKRAYRESNPEKLAARSMAYRDKNKEKIAAYAKSNAEKAASSTRAWREANPDKSAAHFRNRRARVREADGSHTAADIRAIFESQCGLCASCHSRLIKSGKKKYHVDHIKPLALGGSNDKYNLQCLCPECNLKKRAKDPLDWAKENWRLL